MRDCCIAVVLGAGLITGCSQSPGPPVPRPSRSVTEVPGAGDFARQSFASPLSIEDAEQILVRTRVFEFGGMPPKRQVQAFNVLLDQPDAVARFKRVSDRGELAGRLYALCAVSTLDKQVARTLAVALGQDQTRVLVIDSDVIRGSMTSEEVVFLIQQQQVGPGMRSEKEETAKYFQKKAG
jgi:hypothetical protein